MLPAIVLCIWAKAEPGGTDSDFIFWMVSDCSVIYYLSFGQQQK